MARKLPRVAVAILVLCLAAPLAATEKTAPVAGGLTDAERQALIELLEGTAAEMEALLSSFEGDDWSWKPAPESWSAGEVAEHLMLSEELIFSTVQETVDGEPNPDWQTASAGKLERIRQFMPDRSQKVTAPSEVTPTGDYTREQILESFAEARAETLRFARETELPLKTHTRTHPAPFFGELNAHQWLVFLGEHNRRHNQQIAEIKEALEASR